jgi:hypothetical protein
VQGASRPNVPFTVYAEATVYGVTRRDSLTILVKDQLICAFSLLKSTPLGSTIPVFSLLPAYPQTIAVGGWVWWFNETLTDSLDIVFDDPSAASPDPVYGSLTADTIGGNIARFPGDTNALSASDPFQFLRARQFLRAGTFHFHSPSTGVSGTVIVR